MVLGRSAHHQQVTRVQDHSVACTALLRPEVKGSWASEAHDGDQWVDLGSTDPICVPRHTVAAALVVVAEETVECSVVMR